MYGCINLPKNHFSKNWPFVLGLIILAVVYVYSFGLTGFRFILIVAVFSLPSYFILNLFDLDDIEKIIFSFFLSISIVSSSVYWLSFPLNSIKASFILLIVFLTASVIILNILKNNNLLFFKEKHKSE